MILWAHSGHITEAPLSIIGDRPMGRVLAESLREDYFSISTLTAAGSYLQWEDPSHTQNYHAVTKSFPALQPSAFESSVRQRGEPLLLIPFRKVLPAWLTTPVPFNLAGAAGPAGVTGTLPLQYDAAIFIDTTTAMHPLAH
jgi:erythromycin esterase-like protein